MGVSGSSVWVILGLAGAYTVYEHLYLGKLHGFLSGRRSVDLKADY